MKDALAGAQVIHHTPPKGANHSPQFPLYYVCLVAFAAFLRFDELTKLVCSDVTIDSGMLHLFINSSQTAQFRNRA